MISLVIAGAALAAPAPPCGLVAAFAAAESLGVTVDVDRLAARLGPGREHSLLAVHDALLGSGVDVALREVGIDEFLASLDDNAQRWIVPVRSGPAPSPADHAIAVLASDGERVTIAQYPDGVEAWPLDHFLSRWDGGAAISVRTADARIVGDASIGLCLLATVLGLQGWRRRTIRRTAAAVVVGSAAATMPAQAVDLGAVEGERSRLVVPLPEVEEALVVREALVSCSACMRLLEVPPILLPGPSATCTLLFDPGERRGPQSLSLDLVVVTARGDEEAIFVPIDVYVRGLSWEPAVMRLDSAAPGERTAGIARLHAWDLPPLDPTAIGIDHAAVSCTLLPAIETTSRLRRRSLLFAVDIEVPHDAVAGRTLVSTIAVTLVPDGARREIPAPLLELAVPVATVWEVIPPVLFFGVAPTGGTSVVTLHAVPPSGAGAEPTIVVLGAPATVIPLDEGWRISAEVPRTPGVVRGVVHVMADRDVVAEVPWTMVVVDREHCP